MDNPYGLVNLWAQGDAITRAVAIGLLFMSIVSWSVIAIKTWQLIRLRKAIPIAAGTFWHSKNLEQGLDLLRTCGTDNPFSQLAQAGITAAAHHAHYKDDLQGALNISDWITSCLRRTIDDAAASLQSGLSWLASIGSTAPFVGLFGTVWGIYHALIGISVAGQATIDKVAGPVGEALIMTALGLAVAIPAVLGFNALSRTNKSMLTRFNRFAHDLHAYFVTGGRLSKPLKKNPQNKLKAGS